MDNSPKSKRSEREQQLIKNKEASVPVIADLVQLGFNVDWISDLYNHKHNYREAIPILIHWLPYIDAVDVKEEIVRALSVPWAKPVAAKVLINEFRKAETDNVNFKWAIANAISIVVDDSSLDSILELVQDIEHGKAREMLALALGNMKGSYEAEEMLIELLDDDACVGHAIKALGKIKSKRALLRIKQLLVHPKPWVRKEAKAAIIKIERAYK